MQRQKFGAAQTTEPHSATDIVGRASIQASTKDTSAELSYERDITTSGGFGTLMKVDTVSANVGASLINRLYGSLSLDFLRLKQVNGEGLDVKILEPTASLEYKYPNISRSDFLISTYTKKLTLTTAALIQIELTSVSMRVSK